MKNSIDFLPERKQRDLRELAALIRDEVKDVVMIILYGSYAANTYVERDERRDYGVRTIYMSDYDLLVVTKRRLGERESTVEARVRERFAAGKNDENLPRPQSINKFMNAAYSDANKFWADFMEQVNILLDSRRYCRECKILGLKPEYVAEHIVFLGSATMKKVLKDGVSRTLGADVQLYGKRFSPEDADRFLSEDIKPLPEQTTVA